MICFTPNRCGFLNLTPESFDQLGTDLHDCLHTFELHPAVGVSRRPAHFKSAMRLRPRPRPAVAAPPSFPRPAGANRGVPEDCPGVFDEGQWPRAVPAADVATGDVVEGENIRVAESDDDDDSADADDDGDDDDDDDDGDDYGDECAYDDDNCAACVRVYVRVCVCRVSS